MSKDKAAVKKLLDAVKASGRTSLTAPEGKQVCDAYGIAVPGEGVAKSAEEAGKLAAGMGFPVVMKIVSPDILHKTEAGGVALSLRDPADVAAAAERLTASARKAYPDARIDGFLLARRHGTGEATGEAEDAIVSSESDRHRARLPINDTTDRYELARLQH